MMLTGFMKIMALQRIGKVVPNPNKHPATSVLMKAIRDAIYIVNGSDKINIGNVLYDKFDEMTFDEMFESNPDWILKQVRRLCPEPEIIKKNLEEALATFRKSEFQFEGLPVLTSDAIKEFRTLIDVHVSKGCLSDPIGVSLYRAIGYQKLN
ncbi:hypothetical protein HK100_001743 [Physocladia obscura]|uniref:Uncharacterized protein n=1 Tax=Physocladia obscura TaxID=109957 RepID=A0AAD5T897_9FUNG|nr:hypothetical protein HK100_001743 [Physocladia obscura]